MNDTSAKDTEKKATSGQKVKFKITLASDTNYHTRCKQFLISVLMYPKKLLL
jgi:hypothetical protein